MLWPDNRRYEGEFINGKMEGKGVMTWPNGNRYNGMWKNDMQHGPGMFFSAKSGKETPEEWRDGKRWTWTKAGDNGHSPLKNKKIDKDIPAIFQQKTNQARREEGWAR